MAPRPSPPFKPPHLARLSFPNASRPTSTCSVNITNTVIPPPHPSSGDLPTTGTTATDFDSAQQISSAYAAAGAVHARAAGGGGSLASHVSEEDEDELNGAAEQQQAQLFNAALANAPPPRDAWALFDFEGEEENEVSCRGRDHLEIITHTLPTLGTAGEGEAAATAAEYQNGPPSPQTEGWSLALVTSTGQLGLIPQTYFSVRRRLSSLFLSSRRRLTTNS